MYIREIAVKGLARTHISLFPSALSRIQVLILLPGMFKRLSTCEGPWAFDFTQGPFA
ncbi:hypothetical protein TC41_3237 [Alicyclobacillus acidocaldarius subsp. acidocaldarius Tc-4-1]|uniref:Uncharacterized protein n=1 Tax=Alicyclobacillus acidocaldarius (strain Tc-4-1) TaxID=1048834 RepID=F8IDS3_ALIAT|nr:hypothetical protein TC41_3237 [Alicyclobacillus acidocaldarius subsp. acidocaldarius Tc-4-1]